jgi:hypothetical protein
MEHVQVRTIAGYYSDGVMKDGIGTQPPVGITKIQSLSPVIILHGAHDIDDTYLSTLSSSTSTTAATTGMASVTPKLIWVERSCLRTVDTTNGKKALHVDEVIVIVVAVMMGINENR